MYLNLYPFNFLQNICPCQCRQNDSLAKLKNFALCEEKGRKKCPFSRSTIWTPPPPHEKSSFLKVQQFSCCFLAGFRPFLCQLKNRRVKKEGKKEFVRDKTRTVKLYKQADSCNMYRSFVTEHWHNLSKQSKQIVVMDWKR